MLVKPCIEHSIKCFHETWLQEHILNSKISKCCRQTEGRRKARGILKLLIIGNVCENQTVRFLLLKHIVFICFWRLRSAPLVLFTFHLRQDAPCDVMHAAKLFCYQCTGTLNPSLSTTLPTQISPAEKLELHEWNKYFTTLTTTAEIRVHGLFVIQNDRTVILFNQLHVKVVFITIATVESAMTAFQRRVKMLCVNKCSY